MHVVGGKPVGKWPAGESRSRREDKIRIELRVCMSWGWVSRGPTYNLSDVSVKTSDSKTKYMSRLCVDALVGEEMYSWQFLLCLILVLL